jgi:hypothetical protein
MFSFATVDDWNAASDLVRRGHYGIIETRRGRFSALHLRPWPKLVSWREIWPVGLRYHGGGDPDCCRLYYNQPRSYPNFLALRYIVSTPRTSYATFRAALVMLDAVAELKGIDAVVCDAANVRLSDRLFARFGWEPHKPQRWHRNYIRRYYGVYPQQPLPLGKPRASKWASAALVGPSAAC